MNILEARRRVLGGEVYKKTAEGNPVSVRSLARMRPGLSVMGRSTQKTTTGGQLLDVSTDISTQGTVYGINVIIDHDGIVIDGEASGYADIYFKTDMFERLPYGKYTMSINDVAGIQAWFNNGNDVTPSKNGALTFDWDGNIAYLIIRVSSGTRWDNYKIKVMLNSGSTSLPWEPYTGGQPSPSPDYPQEIHSSGDDGSIQIGVFGGNLCFDETLLHGSTKNTDLPTYTGKITVAMKKESGSKQVNMRVWYLDGTMGNDFSVLTTSSPPNAWVQKVVEVSDAIGLSMYNAGSAGEENTGLKVVVKLGEHTITEYESYKQPQSLTVQTPNGLPGIPVNSGGNYTDENGQQWICDEIDFRRGKYVQRVYKLKLSKDLPYYTVSGEYISLNIKPLGYPEGNGISSLNVGFCSFTEYRYNYGEMCAFVESGVVCLGRDLSQVFGVNVDTFKQFLADNGVQEILYIISEPIETDLTEEQLSAYANLHTNRPTTIVSATDDAGIKLTYKTKKSLEVTD